MAQSPRRRAISETSHVRPGLTGLGIEFFPIHNIEAQNVPSIVSPTKKNLVCNPFPHSFSKANIVEQVAHMRSMKGMEGLSDAEYGGSMVEFNPFAREGGSGFKAGQKIGPVPAMSSRPSSRRITTRNRSATVSGASLARSGTFFSLDATTSRKSAELKTLLGRSGRKASAKSIAMPSGNGYASPTRSSSDFAKLSLSSSVDVANVVSLEKAKTRARVEVDIELESDVVVEGGRLRGKMQVCIRSATKNEGPIWIGGGKLRIVGFEGLPTGDTRYVFYQHSELLSNITTASHLLFTSEPDLTGFCRAREGTHTLPFSMPIPIRGAGGCPKGIFQGRGGPSIRYIAMGSLKIKEGSSALSVAHFYRHIEVFPFVGFDVLLPAPQPVQASTSQSVFLGGSGKLRMTVSLHRQVWVAGQSCSVLVTLENHTTKKVKNLIFTIIRTTTFFKPKVELDALEVKSPMSADMDACQTTTSRKEIAQVALGMGQKGEKGIVTAKGFWTGVDMGQRAQISNLVLIPADALSIPRGRLLEVNYHLKVSAGSGALTTDVNVAVPLRIISFLSIDPPPNLPSLEPPSAEAPLGCPRGTSSNAAPHVKTQNDLAYSGVDPTYTLPWAQSLSGREKQCSQDGMPGPAIDTNTSSFLRAFPPRDIPILPPSTMEVRFSSKNLAQTSPEGLPQDHPILQVVTRDRTVAFEETIHLAGHEDTDHDSPVTQELADTSQSIRDSVFRSCNDTTSDGIVSVPPTSGIGIDPELIDEVNEDAASDKPTADTRLSDNTAETFLVSPSVIDREVLRISNSHQGVFASHTRRHDLQYGRIPGLPKLSSSTSLRLVNPGSLKRSSLLRRATWKSATPTQLTESTDNSRVYESPSVSGLPRGESQLVDEAEHSVLSKGRIRSGAFQLRPTPHTQSSLVKLGHTNILALSEPDPPFRPESSMAQARSLSKSDSSALGSRSSRWSSSTTNSAFTNSTGLGRQSSASSFSDAASSVRVKIAKLEARDRAVGSTNSSPMLPVQCHFVPLVRSSTFQIAGDGGDRQRKQGDVRLVAQRPRSPERLAKSALGRN